MTIEAASFINQLDPTRPLAADIISEGDDHQRLMKSVTKASFPNIGGAVSASHTELNYVTGVTSAIQTQLNNLSSSSNAAFSQSATYPAATVGKKLQQIVCIADFAGDDNTGTTDTLATFNSAMAYLPSTGGAIYVPRGTRNVSNEIVVAKSIYFYGDGYASAIATTSATANIFTITAAFAEIHGLRMVASITRTAGWYVDVTSSGNRFRISNFVMDGALQGIRTLAAASCTIQQGEIINGIASTGVAIRIDAGADVTINDVLTDNSGQLFAAVYITNVADVAITDCQFIHGGQALYVNCGAGQNVTSLWVNNTFFDNSTRGLNMLAAGGAIARSNFVQCWFSSASAEGIRLDCSGGGTIQGTDFVSCHVFLNAADGLAIVNTGVTNTRILGGAFSQNTGAGIDIFAGVGDVSIIGARIGPTHGLTGNGYGILIPAGAGNNIQIIDNDLRGNTTANLSNGATGTSVIIENNLGTVDSWTAYTPTVTSTTGTITTLGAVTGRYRKFGKSLFIEMDIPITTNGTGATAVLASLPAGFTSASNQIVAGRENAVTGTMLQGVLATSSTTLSITRYDNAYPAANGYRLNMTGVIEIA